MRSRFATAVLAAGTLLTGAAGNAAGQVTPEPPAVRFAVFAGVPLVGGRVELVSGEGLTLFADGSRWFRGIGACADVSPSECEGEAWMAMAGVGRNLRAFFVEGMVGAYHYSGTERFETAPGSGVFRGVAADTYLAFGAAAGLRARVWRNVAVELGLRAVRPFGDDEYRAEFERSNSVAGMAVGVSYRLPLR